MLVYARIFKKYAGIIVYALQKLVLKCVLNSFISNTININYLNFTSKNVFRRVFLSQPWGFPPASLGGASPPTFLKDNFQWSQPPPQFWTVLNTLFV